jgi:hypothetical protein
MKRALPIILLIALLVVFSIVGTMLQGVMPGFGPLPAVFFCVAACMGMRWLWIPMLAWLLSYPLTNMIHGYGWDLQMLIAVGGFGLAVALGYSLRHKQRVLPLLGGSLGAAVLFYVVTNTGAWLLLPDYAKNGAGFIQAQWTGAPHHAMETWVFLRSGLLANILFTSLFLLGQRQWALNLEPRRELAPIRLRR